MLSWWHLICIGHIQNVKVLDDMELAIMTDAERDKAHFVLHRLKNQLPTVVVKVRIGGVILHLPYYMRLEN